MLIVAMAAQYYRHHEDGHTAGEGVGEDALETYVVTMRTGATYSSRGPPSPPRPGKHARCTLAGAARNQHHNHE